MRALRMRGLGWSRVPAVLGLAVLACACESGDSGGVDTGPCKPGAAQPCDCVAGGHGVQYCADDGSWKACNCGITGTDSGGPEDPGGSKDVPPNDVADDAADDAVDDTGCTPTNLQAVQGCGGDGNVHWFDDCGGEGETVLVCGPSQACAPQPEGGSVTCREYCDAYDCPPNPPTGVDQCIDDGSQIECPAFPCETDGTPAFCGQDAQYADRQRVFQCVDRFGNPQDPCDETADSGEIVRDTLTGLAWQRTFLADQKWTEADEYCDMLDYGGHTDWRLPTPAELGGLVHYGRSDPTLDVTAFPGTPNGVFWTSLAAVWSTDQAWTVAFHLGWERGVRLRNVQEDRVVRCVRGGSTRLQGAARFKPLDGAPGVIVDRATGLQWQEAGFTAKKWSEALRYCEGLTTGGLGDWRLPDVNELRSLVDHATHAPATRFPGMPELVADAASDRFWSSTPVFYFEEYLEGTVYFARSWVVDFFTGAVLADVKWEDHRGRCVRGGPQ
jgi:hypothetical protein